MTVRISATNATPVSNCSNAGSIWILLLNRYYFSIRFYMRPKMLDIHIGISEDWNNYSKKAIKSWSRN